MILIREIGILLLLIAIVYVAFLYHSRNSSGFPKEGFTATSRGVGYDELREEALQLVNGNDEIHGTEDASKLDLDVIRKQFSVILSQADGRSHDEPRSPERSSLRVGLERLITELDFMRSERGRFLSASDLEEMLLQSRQRLKAI
jgi:hypothetical protein